MRLSLCQERKKSLLHCLTHRIESTRATSTLMCSHIDKSKNKKISHHSAHSLPKLWKNRLLSSPNRGKTRQTVAVISLIKIDAKIFAKVIANRLQPLLPSLIPGDQVGFIPAREARDNTSRVLNIIGHVHSHCVPLYLLTIDAEKAFDQVG